MEGRYDDGKLAKALEIAKKMKEAGMDVDTICEMTGLKIEKINEVICLLEYTGRLPLELPLINSLFNTEGKTS